VPPFDIRHLPVTIEDYGVAVESVKLIEVELGQ